MPEPIAVYVHIPFCAAKCGYCDFNSHALSGPIVERTVHATVAEIQKSPFTGRPAASIFFGGGTPTLIDADLTSELLRAVLDAHPPLPGCEVSVEANPESASLPKLTALKQAGFNRISIGVQSFDATDLLRLERVHTSQQAENAVQNARQAGFHNLNLDLMFGLEGQTMEKWARNLECAVGLEPDHLSLYNLTIEPGTRFSTRFRQNRLTLPEEEVQAEMYRFCAEFLATKGYAQYEISNYAKPTRQCQHNLWVWRGGEYAGYGPGAVGCGMIDGRRVRYTNRKNPSAYCQNVETKVPLWQEHEAITNETAAFERVMLGLRLNEGLCDEGLSPDAIRTAVSEGWMVHEGGRVRLTDLGRLFANDATLLFL